MFGYYKIVLLSKNALLNRNVFSCFLNELRQSVACMASGRLFQSRGAALEKNSPCVRSERPWSVVHGSVHNILQSKLKTVCMPL